MVFWESRCKVLYLPFTVFLSTYHASHSILYILLHSNEIPARMPGKTGENYLLDPTGNGRHIAGSFFWVMPGYGIPSLTEKNLANQVIFLVRPSTGYFLPLDPLSDR